MYLDPNVPRHGKSLSPTTRGYLWVIIPKNPNCPLIVKETIVLVWDSVSNEPRVSVVKGFWEWNAMDF